MSEDIFGDTLCDRCGDTFDLEEVSADFDHYYAGSSDWKYDQVISERLCGDCAETDAEDRWMAGTLEAADGPPPSADVMKPILRKFLGLDGPIS